jgi:hypothetical protein
MSAGVKNQRKDALASFRTGTATVWACVQKAAAILNAESGGGEAAGRFVAQMGPKAEATRAQAYRLLEIATKKGWAAEALVYNELAQEWPKLEELASSAGARTERARPKVPCSLVDPEEHRCRPKRKRYSGFKAGCFTCKRMFACPLIGPCTMTVEKHIWRIFPQLY